MEGAVKSLRCSAAKHTVRNEKYVVDIVMVQQEAISKQWMFPFNVQYHCSQDIREVRVVYGSTGFDSVLMHNSFIIKKLMVVNLPDDFPGFAFLRVGEDGCFHSLLCCLWLNHSNTTKLRLL
ncbi:hypothetical protein TNCV_2319271 [Trichonephila clavipes]|nr:hypothetical protein TNCV_2319271 [Trichonephila clavipes]